MSNYWNDPSRSTQEPPPLVRPAGASPFRGHRFRNDSGETVPPRAIMAITGMERVNGVLHVLIKKPYATSDFVRDYAVNADVEVPADGATDDEGNPLDNTGWCFLPEDRQPVEVLCASDETPAAGDSLGPVPDEWFVRKDYPATCRCLGGRDATRNTVMVLLQPIDLFTIMLKDSLTPGGTADAYPTKTDGTILDEDFTVEVEDLVGDLRALGKDDVVSGDGAKGSVAALGDGTLALVTMQPMVMWFLAQNTYAVGPGDSLVLKNHNLCQPVGGVIDAPPAGASNAFGQSIAVDEWVLVFWVEETQAWGAFRAAGANALKHGKVYGTFTNVVGTTKNAVSVQACDADGANEVAGAFTVYTPINPDAWTNLKENDVVGYVTDAEGVNIIVTDCWEPDREFLGTLYADLAADDASANVLPTIRVVGRMPAGSTLVSNTLELSAASGDTVAVRRKYSTQGGDDAAGAWFIAEVKGVGGEVTADETWLHAEQDGNDVEISHIGPDAVDPVNGIATAAELTIDGHTLSLTRPFQEFDEKGHRVDEDTVSDSEVTVPDEKVKANSADPTAGYLDEKLEGDTYWIGTPTYDGVNHKVKIEHIASGIAYGAAVPAAILTASGASTEITVTPKDIQLDACRHVVSMNAGTPVSWDLADHLAGSQWITLTPAAGVITIEHADAYTVTQEGASPTIGRSGQTVTVSFAVPQFDAKGHYKQDDGTPETDTFTLPIIDVSGDGTWTSVSTTAGDATVSHIGPGSTDSTTTQDALSLNEDSDPVIRLTTKRLNVDAKGHVASETAAVTSDLTLVEVTWYEWDITGGDIKKRLHTIWVPKHTVGSWTNVFTYGECS